jgi:hypothetical protein
MYFHAAIGICETWGSSRHSTDSQPLPALIPTYTHIEEFDMRKTMLSLALLTAFASSALAAHLPAAATALTTQAGHSIARHGADDGPGDDRGNDGPGHTSPMAKHGADDGPGDDRGNDGPGHMSGLA